MASRFQSQRSNLEPSQEIHLFVYYLTKCSRVVMVIILKVKAKDIFITFVVCVIKVIIEKSRGGRLLWKRN